MRIIDALITDRKQADVTKLASHLSKPKEMWTDEERSEFLLAKDKGAYNATDLNRVQEAMEYLADRLRGYGYNVPEIKRPSVNGRDYWIIGDIPRKEQMDQYLTNLNYVKNVFGLLKSTPDAPSTMDHITHNEANAIEQILVDIEFVINHTIQSMSRLDAFMFVSGQAPFPSASTDYGRTWDDIDALGLNWDDLDDGEAWYTMQYGVIK